MQASIDIKPKGEDNDRLAVVSRGIEFLKWSSSTNERFDKIIANPPYLAIERVQRRIREASCSVQTIGGIRVTAGCNCWFAFLCAAINLLHENGSLCFLLPAAFEYANYARDLRGKIASHFEHVAVYRSHKPLFADVQEGSVILLARGFRSSGERPPESRGTSIRETFRYAEELFVPKAETAQSVNADGAIYSPSVIEAPETKPAHQLLRIGIGAVTGDAKFFLMNDQQRRVLGLPTSVCRPVLTRARHLSAHVITPALWQTLRTQGERVWLFYPVGDALEHPAVAKYLRWGRSGGCKVTNHKVAIRSPWFRVLLPQSFDGFMSGMSASPFIALRNMERLTATNTLYGVTFLQGSGHEVRCGLALGLLTSRVQEQLLRVQRNYADGLTKYELGDLRELRLITPQKVRGAASAYRRATIALLAQRHSEARGIADDWFSR